MVNKALINKRCTTIHIYRIVSARYSVMCKIYTEYHGTSETEHGLCACTVDNPLAKARDYLSVQAHKPCSISHAWKTLVLHPIRACRKIPLLHVLLLPEGLKVFDNIYPNGKTDENIHENINTTLCTLLKRNSELRHDINYRPLLNFLVSSVL